MQSQVDGMIAATRTLFDLSADRKKAMAAALSPLYRGACTCNNQSVSQSPSVSQNTRMGTTAMAGHVTVHAACSRSGLRR